MILLLVLNLNVVLSKRDTNMSNILEQSEYAVKTRNQTIILEHLKYYYFTTKKGRLGLFSCSFFMFLLEVLFPFC